MKKLNPYTKSLSILQGLKKEYPNQSLGQHLSTALADYPDLWSISDKEILFALEKYQTEKDMNIATDDDIQSIYRDGLNITNPSFWDDEEDL
jgi:hypothetical protein